MNKKMKNDKQKYTVIVEYTKNGKWSYNNKNIKPHIKIPVPGVKR